MTKVEPPGTADFSRPVEVPTKVGGPAVPTEVGGPGGPLGWYSRGYLPHLDTPGLIQGVTFRLADSLPRQVLEQMRSAAGDSAARRELIEGQLNAGFGACWLRNPRIAGLVEAELLRFDGNRYRLLGWTLTTNHVHLLVKTWPDHALFRVVQGWKGSSAVAANRLLGRTGAFWARDYFDRYIRDDAHLAAAIRYIDQNRVKAGFVERAEEWPFGSAHRRTADFSRRVEMPTEVGGPGPTEVGGPGRARS
jgi:putative transposase